MQFNCPRVICNGGFALIQSAFRFRAAKVRMVLATGATKRPILEQVRAGADYPIAQVTKDAGETWWFVDRAAAPES